MANRKSILDNLLSKPSSLAPKRRLSDVHPSMSTKYSRTKRKRFSLTNSEQHMIFNIFNHIMETWPCYKYRSTAKVVNKTAQITGVQLDTIYEVLGNFNVHDVISETGKMTYRRTMLKKLDDVDKATIRNIIHRFFIKGELPTLKKILNEVNSEGCLPMLKMKSLRRVLRELKFQYIHKNRKSTIIDRQETVLCRTEYLDKIDQHRQENHRIFYLYEMYVDSDWIDIEWAKGIQGDYTGIRVENGKRLIMGHIGNEAGFLEDCNWACKFKKQMKSMGKRHQESMTTQQFERWFHKILGKLQPNDVIVMDNASYHCRKVEETPSMAWRKQRIQEWLQSNSVTFEESENKAQLIVKANAIKCNQSYIVDEMAKAKGVTVLRLPPYHCQLNPIKLIWDDVKKYVAQQNTCFNDKTMIQLLTDGLTAVTTERWQSCVEQVQMEEAIIREMDHQIDKRADRFLLTMTDESSQYNSLSDLEDGHSSISDDSDCET